MWPRTLRASRTGRHGSGTYSFVANQNSTATATCSSAIGEGTTATSTAAHSQGFGSEAGLAAHAEGYYTVASSSSSHAKGTKPKRPPTTRTPKGTSRTPPDSHLTPKGTAPRPRDCTATPQDATPPPRQQRQRHRVQRHRRPSQQHGGWSMERLEPRWVVVCRGQRRGRGRPQRRAASGHCRQRACRRPSVRRGFRLAPVGAQPASPGGLDANPTEPSPRRVIRV